MRAKLRRLNAPHGRGHVETIAGWALRYASAYPGLGSLPCAQPRTSEEWARLYDGVAEMLMKPTIARVIAQSYEGLVVDEYQDCSPGQHKIVLALSAILPTRVLGDPLQAIFRFGGQEVVNWEEDVLREFERLEDLGVPHRWEGRNEGLGTWLADVRSLLERGEPILLETLPEGVRWYSNAPETQRHVCYEATAKERVVGLFGGAEANRCHDLTRRLNGSFQGVEPIDSRDLYRAADRIEQAQGGDRVEALVEFAALCRTQVRAELDVIVQKIRRDPAGGAGRLKRNLDQFRALQAVAQEPTLAPVLAALESIERLPTSVLHRRELWESMRRSLIEFEKCSHTTLAEAAWIIRQAERASGRQSETRAISRTVLAKGLEYDHAIVLDASTLDREQLYVALTRASDTLTVLAPRPVLDHHLP